MMGTRRKPVGQNVWGVGMTERPTKVRYSIVGGMFALTVHGFLVWFVIPLATVCWPLFALEARSDGVTFRQYLGWVDFNLMVCLEHSVLRPFVETPLKWISRDRMAEVIHRFRPLDAL